MNTVVELYYQKCALHTHMLKEKKAMSLVTA